MWMIFHREEEKQGKASEKRRKRSHVLITRYNLSLPKGKLMVNYIGSLDIELLREPPEDGGKESIR